MNDDVEQLLKNLKLSKILEVIDRELKRATKEGSSYEELVARLLREEYIDRQSRRVENRLKSAKLPERWALETFPFKQQPRLKQAVIRQLAELEFIPQATNVVFIGDTGVGKTGLAIGLLIKAIESGYRGLFIKAQDLFDNLYTSLADRSTRSVLNRLVKLDLIVIDEMGYLNLRPEQSNIFFKLMEERYGHKATIITTNLDYDAWYGFLGNKEMVGALLDRMRHSCHTITIKGTSLRTPVHPEASESEVTPSSGPSKSKSTLKK